MTMYRKSKFTLVEVIVGMAVLSVLMLMLLRFFSGAQKIWSSTENKNQLYANSRVSMNLMASILQSMYYTDDKSMFVYKAATDSDKIYFSTRSSIHPRGDSNFYFSSFQRDSQNQLIFGIHSNETIDGKTNTYFWNDVENIKTNPAGTISDICSSLDDNKSHVVIIPHVMSFKVRIALKAPTSQTITWQNSPTYYSYTDGAPVAVEITMTLLNESDYLKWTELNSVSSSLAPDFLKDNQQSFTRIIFLGDRNKI